MIKYKKNIIKALKDKGISTYTLRKNNLLGQSTITKLNNSDTSITLNNLSVLCKLLDCQPADLIEYVDDEETEKKF